MAVPAVPFWLSAANTEFAGNGWASNIMSKAGLAVPGWASSLAGKSAVTVVGSPPGTIHNAKKASYGAVFNNGNTVFVHNNGGSQQTVQLTSKEASHVRYTLQSGGNYTPQFNYSGNGVLAAIATYGSYQWPEFRIPSWPASGYYDALIKMELFKDGTLLATWNIWLDSSSQ